MQTPRRWVLGAIILGLATFAACASGSSSSSPATPQGALASFAKAFDDAAGQRRLVLLMSPT